MITSITPFAVSRRLNRIRRARTTERRTKLTFEALEDRRLVTLVFDPTYTHPPIYPDGHAFLQAGSEGFAEAGAMIIQPLDDKIVLGGIVGEGGVKKFRVARVGTNGRLDSTFDMDGVNTQSFYGVDDRIRALAIQPSNQWIVAAGGVAPDPSNPTTFRFGLMRFRADGSWDNTGFQGANDPPGQVSIRFVHQNEMMLSGEAFGVDVDDLGRILVVGRAQFSGQTRFAVARLLPNGAFDNSFDGDGRATYAIASTSNVARTVDTYLDSQGIRRILVGGWVDGNTDFAAFRLLDDGTSDADFGDLSTPGFRTIDVSGNGTSDAAWGLIRQPNEHIVMVGSTGGNGTGDFAIARLLPNARGGNNGLDPTFANNGIKLHDFLNIDQGRKVTLQDDGTIVIAGFTTDDAGLPGQSKFYLGRFTSTGHFIDQINSRFPNTGGDSDQAWGVAIQSDGKIVAGGFHTDSSAAAFATIRVSVESESALAGTGGSGVGGSLDSDNLAYSRGAGKRAAIPQEANSTAETQIADPEVSVDPWWGSASAETGNALHLALTTLLPDLLFTQEADALV